MTRDKFMTYNCLPEDCSGLIKPTGDDTFGKCNRCGHTISYEDYDKLHSFMINHYRRGFQYADADDEDFWTFNEEDQAFYAPEEEVEELDFSVPQLLSGIEDDDYEDDYIPAYN